MPFPKEVRDWWMRATGEGNATDAQCQWRYFDVSGTLRQCVSHGEQVHHPIAEAYLLYCLLQNPNEIEGLVVCQFHHIMGRLGVYMIDGSFHPDMGEARRQYHNDHDSFRKAGHLHHQLAVEGKRFWSGDEFTDEYYREIARQIGVTYTLTHPEDPKPPIPRHKNLMEPQKWYQVIFGTDEILK